MIAIISYYNPFQNLDGFFVHLYYVYRLSGGGPCIILRRCDDHASMHVNIHWWSMISVDYISYSFCVKF